VGGFGENIRGQISGRNYRTWPPNLLIRGSNLICGKQTRVEVKRKDWKVNDSF